MICIKWVSRLFLAGAPSLFAGALNLFAVRRFLFAGALSLVTVRRFLFAGAPSLLAVDLSLFAVRRFLYSGARLHRVPTYFFRFNKAFAMRFE